MVHRHCPLRPVWPRVAIVCGVMFLAGCQSLPPSLVSCPLPAKEQVARVQDLVPIGTPRDEAVAILQKVGIGGSFGTANSIFYCQTWTQSEDERWHIDVQLLFNESGEVYAFRTEPDQYAVSRSEDVGAGKVSKPARAVAAGPKPSITDPFAE